MIRAARTDTASGLALIATAAIAWGTIPLVLEATGNVHPVIAVFYRVGISALVLLVVAPFTGTYRELKSMSRQNWFGLVTNGVLLAVNWVLFFLGLKLAGVAVGEILGYTGPVWVAVLLPLLLKERFDHRVMLPLALALSGTVAVLLATVGHESGSSVLPGALLAFASSLTYAMLILNAKRLLRGVGAVTLMLVEDVVAATLLSPALLFLAGPTTAREWGALATLAIVLTVGTGFLFLSGLKRVRADHGAILTYAEPVSAVVFGAIFLGQHLTFLVGLGGALVVTGGIIVARMGPTPAIEVPSLITDAIE
ncbi:MAG: EamA family transporter [Coriobacteriia bacterium]|nr:EamA family transporter [Coriobacteriia bacterium]